MILGIKLDSRLYFVWIGSGDNDLSRRFAFVEGGNGGTTQAGSDILDTIGTKYSYSFDVAPDVNHPGDYDDFYWAVSNPARIHTVELPFGQGTQTFACRIDGGQDGMTMRNGARIWQHLWQHLSITVTPIAPQRMAED